jgi:hypothetical protein
MSKWELLVRSRKFWAAIVGFAMLLVKEFVPNFPFDEAQVQEFVWIVIAFIVGTGIEDSGVLRK